MAQPNLDVSRQIREYERRINALIRRSRVIRVSDVWRIRREYSTFLREAAPYIAGQTGFGRAASEQLLRALALRVDEMSNRVIGIVRDGVTAQVELAQRGLSAYAAEFTGAGSGLTALSISPTQLDAILNYSADLIGVRSGGIGAEMLRRVNSAIRLAALGVGDQRQSIAAINRALGGPAAWSYRAERIYVTETLRAHSITTEQGIRDLDRRVPTGKKWMWSHISRQEHAEINGQIVAADKKFRVPIPATKAHGRRIVLMRFPRDPAAPPEATIFCGCYVVAIPMTASRDSAAA